MMDKTLHGVIHGKTIELCDPVGLVDGQEVEVVVKFSTPNHSSGAGLRNSAGGLADYWTGEDDQILAQIEQDRKRDTR